LSCLNQDRHLLVPGRVVKLFDLLNGHPVYEPSGLLVNGVLYQKSEIEVITDSHVRRGVFLSVSAK